MVKTVGLIFGGKSSEHEISWISAQTLYQNADKTKWHLLCYWIDKEGLWWQLTHTDAFLKAKRPSDYPDDQRLTISFVPTENGMAFATKESTLRPDAIFPMVHGANGEDGTLQGFLSILGLPYAGPNTTGAAVSFDKDITKRLLKEASLPVVPSLCLHRNDAIPSLKDMKLIGFPCFVKPARNGSSLGISKVLDHDGLCDALKHAFLFDDKALIEKAIIGRELECSVLATPIPKASSPGEVITGHDFYDFDAKYIHTDDLILHPKADVPESVKEAIEAMAIQAFEVLDCQGMLRVDFFLDEKGDLWINEANGIPGFTPLSLYPAMWAQSGLSYTDLVTALLEEAIRAHKHQAKYLAH